jgi:hypothetical protein
MNKLYILLLSIFLISFTSSYYAGDTIVLQTNFTNPLYNITGNLTAIPDLNISNNNGTISFIIPYDTPIDSFIITFYDNITSEIIEIPISTSKSSGGGGYYDPNWKNKKVKIVNTTVENETIPVVKTKPEEIKNETIPVVIEEKEKSNLWILLLSIGIIIVAVFIIIKRIKKNREKLDYYSQSSHEEYTEEKEVKEDERK